MYEHWKVEERMDLWRQEDVPFTEAERLRYEFLEGEAQREDKPGLLGRIFALLRPGQETDFARDRADADLTAAVTEGADHRRN